MNVQKASFVDAHCHIDLFPEPTKLVAEAQTYRVYTIAVTNTPSVFPFTQSLVEGSRFVRAAVGLHPELAASRYQELPKMWGSLKHTRYVGEIGLDYQTQDEANRRLQREVFEQILRNCADYGNKILTIHSRRATGDVINMIGNNFAGKIILHWYSGSLRDLRRAIDYGFYFSINSAMVKSQKGQRLILEIPQDRLLTETDGPFITTGNMPCSPRTVMTTIASASSLINISPAQLQVIVLNNFQSLLNG